MHIQPVTVTESLRVLSFFGGYMQNKVFYYARVSSKEQHLDRQLEAFRRLGADERDIITDKESGKSLERSGYQALKNTMLTRH